MKDLFGKALYAYYHGEKDTELKLHNKFSEPDILELDGYFFEPDEMTDLELIAMDFCQGRVGDVGAATGRHTLYLQALGMDVTGIEISGSCAKLMKERGVKKVIQEDFFSIEEEKFDTLFLLMNGIGIAGNLNRLDLFLKKAESLLNPGGIIIFDSSDISYLQDKYNLPSKPYFGEIDYRYEWKGEIGEWFTWLYIDENTLLKTMEVNGWHASIVFRDEEDGQYLAILSKK